MPPKSLFAKSHIPKNTFDITRTPLKPIMPYIPPTRELHPIEIAEDHLVNKNKLKASDYEIHFICLLQTSEKI